MDITKIVDAVHESTNLTTTYQTCLEDKGSPLECLKNISLTAAKDVLVDHSGLVQKILAINQSREYIRECLDDTDHHASSCTMGAITEYGMIHITEHISHSLLMTTPISPCPPANVAIGALGLFQSEQIGHSFGDLMVNVMDYLIDHVPSQAIDTTQPLILGNQAAEIQLNPNELKFVNGLVLANQVARHTSRNLSHTVDSLIDDLDRYVKRTRADAIQFHQLSNQIQIQLDSNLKLTKALNLMDLTTLKPIATKHLERLTEPIKTDYIEQMARMASHNQQDHQTHTASVGYNSSGWKISFTVSTNFGGYGGGKGGHGGGGISCNIL